MAPICCSTAECDCFRINNQADLKVTAWTNKTTVDMRVACVRRQTNAASRGQRSPCCHPSEAARDSQQRKAVHRCWCGHPQVIDAEEPCRAGPARQCASHAAAKAVCLSSGVSSRAGAGGRNALRTSRHAHALELAPCRLAEYRDVRSHFFLPVTLVAARKNDQVGSASGGPTFDLNRTA